MPYGCYDKVGHGETVTVRVPTHKDGKSLYWEFATDTYDIGFGVFFEWVEAEDTQVGELKKKIKNNNQRK